MQCFLMISLENAKGKLLDERYSIQKALQIIQILDQIE